jgi:aspartokinase
MNLSTKLSGTASAPGGPSVRVQKFGGSCLYSTEQYLHVASYLEKVCSEGARVVAVVSAMGKTTQSLIDLAERVSPNPSLRELDLLLSTGEQQSIALLGIALKARGILVRVVHVFELGITTDNRHGSAEVIRVTMDRLGRWLEEFSVVVVPGFVGATEDGAITTLGREASDLTAVLLASALGVPRCELFKEVDGVYTADPGLVPGAQRLAHLDYQDMLELARSGAKILHPSAVRLAQQHRILLELKTLHRPDTSTTVGAPEAPSGAIPLALTLRQDCLIARVAKEHQSRFSGWLRESGAEQLVLAQPESFAPVGRPESPASASWLLATDRRGFPLPEYAQAEEAAAVTLVGPIADDVIQRGHEVLVSSGSTARILGFARSQRAARWVVSPADGAATCRVLHRRLFERTE